MHAPLKMDLLSSGSKVVYRANPIGSRVSGSSRANIDALVLVHSDLMADGWFSSLAEGRPGVFTEMVTPILTLPAPDEFVAALNTPITLRKKLLQGSRF